MTQQLSKQLIVGALVMATTLVALFALRRAGSSPQQPPAITQPPRVPIALVDAAAPPQPTEALDPETRLLVGDAEAAARIYRASAEELPGLLCAFEAQANPAVTYAALARNADRFAGELVTFRGRVLEVHDQPRSEGAGSFLRLGLNSYGDHVIAVQALTRPSDTVVENARVRVYGRMMGVFSYRSQAGWDITIPKLVAVAVIPTSEAPRCRR